jgi:hypothetical protein
VFFATCGGLGLVSVSSAQPHRRAEAGVFPVLFSRAADGRATAGHAPAHLSVSTRVQQMNNHPDKPTYEHISLFLVGLTGGLPDFRSGEWRLLRPFLDRDDDLLPGV